MRILLLSFAVVACGPSARDQSGADAPASDGTHGDTQVSDSSRVYAHSGNTLYRIDTGSLQAVSIGTMTGLGTQSLTDLAIDKNDRVVGITLDKVYTIDPTTAAVTLIRALPTNTRGFTSLSFVPMNLNDPASDDMLVSANGQGDVYKIDASLGTAAKIGSYGTVAAGKVVSSGDLIGVRGLGIYATVDVGSITNDYLARIDPVTWTATPLGTGTGYNNIFGLAFWGGTIYGFVDMGTSAGKIITIDPTTGAGHEVLGGSVRWYGAGASTDAPLLQ